MFSINIYTLKQIRLSQHRYDLDLPITTPAVCHHLLDLLLDLKREPVEKFGIISLNTKHRLLGLHVLAVGSLDSVTVEPREVFKAAMVNNLCHYRLPQPPQRRPTAQRLGYRHHPETERSGGFFKHQLSRPYHCRRRKLV